MLLSVLYGLIGIMGHSDISVTLNTYTHLNLDDAIEEIEKLAQKQAEAEKALEELELKESKLKIRKFG